MRIRGFPRVFLLGYLSLAVFSCQFKAPQTITLKVGHVANEDHTWHKAFVYFADLLEKESKGKIQLQVYPSEQLGKEVEIIRSIQAGIVDMTITGGTLQNWTEYAAFSDMPYLLRDTKHLQQLAEGALGKYLEEKIVAETGLRVVAYFERGSRHLTSNRPIRHPDDLKGILLRIPNVPSYVTVWETLGAKPTPMAFSEVFTSLQQGTIEAQENPFAMIFSAGFYEVQKYVNLTGHVKSWGYVIIGEKQFQKLPGDLQDVFLKAAKAMQVYEHQLFLEKEAWLKTQLQAKGMTFIDVDTQVFQEKAKQAATEGLSPQSLKLFDQIKALSP